MTAADIQHDGDVDVGVYKAKNAGRNISITDFVVPKQPEIE